MSATLTYLAGKFVEYTSTLDWVSQQLGRLPSLQGAHTHIGQQLSARLVDARRRLAMLHRVVQLNSPALSSRGLSLTNELQLDILVLSDNYVGAIRIEGEEEQAFTRSATAAAHRCGLTSVQDLLVSLTSGHAILPAFPTAPLLFAPLRQRFTLIDLAGMYHEFGHLAFALHSEIADRLTLAVDTYFLALEQAAGRLTPSERADRLRRIRQATTYWNLDRLNELFSDIFATFVLGPAHYYSCIDLAMRYSDKPHDIDVSDVHPSFGTRITACRLTLPEDHRRHAVSVAATKLWSEYCRRSTPSNEYRLTSPDDLIQEFVTIARERLVANGYLAYTPWHDAPSLQLGADINLEHVLNEATQFLIEHPTSYEAWEERVLPHVFGSP